MKGKLIDRDALEDARKKAGFTSQVKAASFLGVDASTYRRWLSGKHTIPYMAWLCLSLKREAEKGIDLSAW